MPKVKNTSRNKLPLDLNKFPFPIELIRIIISFLPKSWFVPRIPKQFNSKLYHLRALYSYDKTKLFTMGTQVKIKSNVFDMLKKEYKYLVPHSKNLIGKIVGYASPDANIGNNKDVWQIKDAFGDHDPNIHHDLPVLYMVQFLSKHKYINFNGRYYNSNLYHDYDEARKIKKTEKLPYKRTAFIKLEEEAQKTGIYYLFPHQVRYYLDIEDREVFITKTNKVMFNYNI
tara:strand:+ start:269 stop:952 length:684 start_codon:yes stop_codon:yes gene_type:complete